MPDSAVVTGVVGSVGGVVIAWVTTRGTERSKKADQAAQLLGAYHGWTDQLRVSEEKCRAELADVRDEVVEVRRQLDEMRRQMGSS